MKMGGQISLQRTQGHPVCNQQESGLLHRSIDALVATPRARGTCAGLRWRESCKQA